MKIKDIASKETNREILRWLRDNDGYFDEMWVCDDDGDDDDDDDGAGSFVYFPEGARDLEWLGHFIGENTILQKLFIWSDLFRSNNNAVELLCRGLNRNRSIQKIEFLRMNLMGGVFFQSLSPFFEGNNNLSELRVSECEFGFGCARQLLLLIRRCCNSPLKYIKLLDNEMEGGELVDIIETLIEHPQLQELELDGMNVGRLECETLAMLLRGSSSTELHTLCLSSNGIDDECVDTLVDALIPNSNLGVLGLSGNPNITVRGFQRLAALLEHPNCNLEELHMVCTNIDDAGMLIFANALASNRKLKFLHLSDEAGITAEGWSHFLKVLCDDALCDATQHSR